VSCSLTMSAMDFTGIALAIIIISASNNKVKPAAPRTSPGNINGLDATITTTHSRNAGRQIGLVLEKVQMPPCVPLGVVCTAPLFPTTGTRKTTASGKINLDIQTALIQIKLTGCYIPRWSQTQSQLKKFRVSHSDPYQPPQSLDYGTLSCPEPRYPYFLARSQYIV